MLWTKAICGVCVAVLAAAPLVGPPAIMQGDINGDARVDVLDLQSLAAALLEESPERRADVNGDGRVDVLDYQTALAATPGEQNDSPQFPETPSTKGVNPPRVNTDGDRPLSTRVLAAADKPSAPRLSHTGRRSPRTAVTRQVRRYLLKLTPHAPPLGA